jgi:hypothetical protein
MRAIAEDDTGIESVVFTLKGPIREFSYTDTEAPYEWVFQKLTFGKYRLTVQATDDMGKSSTVTMDVLIFML